VQTPWPLQLFKLEHSQAGSVPMQVPNSEQLPLQQSRGRLQESPSPPRHDPSLQTVLAHPGVAVVVDVGVAVVLVVVVGASVVVLVVVDVVVVGSPVVDVVVVGSSVVVDVVVVGSTVVVDVVVVGFSVVVDVVVGALVVVTATQLLPWQTPLPPPLVVQGAPGVAEAIQAPPSQETDWHAFAAGQSLAVLQRQVR
jgi:hypothetical protein